MSAIRNSIAAAVLACAAVGRAGAQVSLVGERVQTFHFDGPPAMHMPTSVAVAPDGSIIVADGVNDRVLVFEPDGALRAEISELNGVRLVRPVGVNVDAAGSIFIAESGGKHVWMHRPNETARQIDAPAMDGAREIDLVAVAPSPDGKSLWTSDNDNDRLLKFDLAAGTWRSIGRGGESLGQFTFPFAVASGASGDVFVVDVLNARVQVLGSDGGPIRAIGQFGANPGQLYRPKGIALDGEQNVWISDSVLGVVQCFQADGRLVDVLRGLDDKPIHFQQPIGLAFDRAGALYVAELGSSAISKLGIRKSASTVARVPPPRPPANTVTPRNCTLCHIEMLPPFSSGGGTELLASIDTSKQSPAVSHAEMCLSCHDGGVVDSRRRVWEQHGHQTGQTPPDWMKVPANLPLVDGKVACRTCHSAHGSGVPEGDFRRAIVLRVPNVASELCMSCHTDKVGGPRFGTHPTGGMPWAVPDKLIQAGARAGPNPRELTCQVCHTPHGSQNDHLLVLGTTTSQLCLTCHDQMRPGMFRDGNRAEHPISPKVNAEQAAAIKELGTKLSPDGGLICLSCHKLHHGKGDRFLLADDLKDGQMCLHCHSQRVQMLGSAHDLRTNYPQERDRLGLTASEGGPCSSCHLFHRFARSTSPGPGDPSGQCLTCHQTGQCAEKKALPAVNHTQARCTDCHNPHETRFAKFLRGKPEDLCTSCHSSQAQLAAGPHDSSILPASWTQSGEAAGDKCLACHRPHGDEAHGMFRVEPAAGQPGAQGACLACHSSVAPDANTEQTLRHPSGQLVSSDGAQRAESICVDCASCHDPHRGGSVAGSLLKAGRPDATDLCLGCHKDMSAIVATAHSPQSLSTHNLDSSACKPCHQVHGRPEDVSARLLWNRKLLAAPPAAQPAQPASMAISDVLCGGCHTADSGIAAAPAIATHPRVLMTDVAVVDNAGAAKLPLFDKDGMRDSTGMPACRTCHTPHGQVSENGSGTIADAATAGQRLQIRSFDPPNVCTNCHGADALRRFLYFHDPEKRGGPITAAR